MPIYVAMLRGINVGGHHKIKMDRLRTSFEGLGFAQVRTYIQSGNVVFQAGKFSPAGLANKIGERILKDFGFSVHVILRTFDEIGLAVKNNPFLKQRNIDLETLHVTFLPEPPDPSVLKELEGLTMGPDQSCCVGKEIYLYLPNGMGRSSLANNPLERRLLNRATTRNWRTVNAIHQMCVDCA
jgi:uncharacterized protein (DUF1697 family)